MKIEQINDKDKEYINVFADKSTSNGLLKFGHEILVTFVKEKNNLMFKSAWHCGVSEMEWDESEENSVNETFPDLLTEVKREIALFEKCAE